MTAVPLSFDVTDTASHTAFFQSLNPVPDGVVAAFGYSGDHAKALGDFAEARRIIETNFTGAASILEIVAKAFEKRGSGFIIGISSVAGKRGRQSNYIYGAAKAGFTAYPSGLRNRLAGKGVQVITVLPGFIHTKMTAQMDLPGLLTAEPQETALDIYQAYLKRKDVIYTKWFWRLIMWVIKMIPEGLFKKLKL